MKTAIDRTVEDRPGVIGIFRVRPEGWCRPTFGVLGRGPWLPRPWRRDQEHLPPLALAYRLYLDGLDAGAVWDRLHDLADGAEPILVTEGQPVKPNLMQRSMIAEWFRRELGEDVPELDGPTLPLVSAIGFDPWAL